MKSHENQPEMFAEKKLEVVVVLSYHNIDLAPRLSIDDTPYLSSRNWVWKCTKASRLMTQASKSGSLIRCRNSCVSQASRSIQYSTFSSKAHVTSATPTNIEAMRPTYIQIIREVLGWIWLTLCFSKITFCNPSSLCQKAPTLDLHSPIGWAISNTLRYESELNTYHGPQMK